MVSRSRQLETGERVSWRCEEGDFICPVADYREALWPPGPEEPEESLGPLLGHHLGRRGLMRGIAQWSVRREDGTLVGDMAAVSRGLWPRRVRLADVRARRRNLLALVGTAPGVFAQVSKGLSGEVHRTCPFGSTLSTWTSPGVSCQGNRAVRARAVVVRGPTGMPKVCRLPVT